MMHEFTWEVLDVNYEHRSFIVRYTIEDKSVDLSLPLMDQGRTLDQIVELYFPKSHFEKTSMIEVHVGQSGVGKVSSKMPETPKMYGSWAEEDIRAMIYDVFQQMKNEEV